MALATCNIAAILAEHAAATFSLSCRLIGLNKMPARCQISTLAAY